MTPTGMSLTCSNSNMTLSRASMLMFRGRSCVTVIDGDTGSRADGVDKQADGGRTTSSKARLTPVRMNAYNPLLRRLHCGAACLQADGVTDAHKLGERVDPSGRGHDTEALKGSRDGDDDEVDDDDDDDEDEEDEDEDGDVEDDDLGDQPPNKKTKARDVSVKGL